MPERSPVYLAAYNFPMSIWLPKRGKRGERYVFITNLLALPVVWVFLLVVMGVVGLIALLVSIFS